MRRKTTSPACQLFLLLLLLGNAVTSNGNTATVVSTPTLTSSGASTTILATPSTSDGTTAVLSTPSPTSGGTTTVPSTSSTSGGTTTTVLSTSSTSGGTTTTVLSTSSTSGGTTTTDPSTQTSTSSGVTTTIPPGTTTPGRTTPGTSAATPGPEERLKGQLRPWEVALIALGSVAMAVILSTGLVLSLKTSPCLRNLFNTDLYHPHGSSLGPCPPGYHGVRSALSAAVADSRDECPPTVMELTGTLGP